MVDVRAVRDGIHRALANFADSHSQPHDLRMMIADILQRTLLVRKLTGQCFHRISGAMESCFIYFLSGSPDAIFGKC
jgi:hypothetical protein